ncbi:hypothetical protein J3F84DRAFT_381429 [Trichoderma pleuroticola]
MGLRCWLSMWLNHHSSSDSAFWVQNLKNAESAVGRAGQDPLWDLFRCNSDRTVSFVQHCPGRCIYTGSPGRDRCEGL